MTHNLSRLQTQKLNVRLDNGREATIMGRSSVGGNWGTVGDVSFTAVAFAKDDAAIFLVNLRGKKVKLERTLDTKSGTITNQKFEETAMLTGMCYILKLIIRLEEETGIPQRQTNGEVAFRG